MFGTRYCVYCFGDDGKIHPESIEKRDIFSWCCGVDVAPVTQWIDILKENGQDKMCGHQIALICSSLKEQCLQGKNK
jgi:hypothetical protein